MSAAKRRRLLSQLADGRWHSGEALAGQLGVSRAAVWKQVQRLREMGLQVFALKGKGYRLARPVELLDSAEIKRHIATQRASRLGSVSVLFTTASTNQVLQEGPQQLDPQLCFAEYQSAGRGRRGRAWHSPLGENLYFSLAWRFATAPTQPAILGLVAGVALVERLRGLGCAGLGLKWPNDLVFEDEKLGGILVEHRGEAAGPGRAIIGVGLNLDMDRDVIEQPWTSLSAAWTTGSPPSRNQLAGEAADAMLAALDEFEREDAHGLLERWRALDVLVGRGVRVTAGTGTSFEGRAMGIAEDGSLIVQTGDQRRRVHAGAVSVRSTS